MRIARLRTRTGSELALVDPAAGTWRRLGVSGEGAWLAALPDLAARQAGPAEPIDEALLLPPVVPRSIVGVGLNYRAHAAEQGKTLPDTPPLFLKHPCSLAAPFGTLPPHPASAQMDYEAELGIVIGREVFDGSEEEAEAAIAGWVIVQDYTLRDLARPETLAIAKGGPGMAPIGPWLTTVESVGVGQASALTITCRVNGELRQHASTADMHFGPVALVRHIARHLPLGPGDVIATEVTGLGHMRQHVIRPA